MITRRGMLAGIFAATAAPAVVRSESLMKIFVPKQEIFIFQDFKTSDILKGLITDFDGDTCLHIGDMDVSSMYLNVMPVFKLNKPYENISFKENYTKLVALRKEAKVKRMIQK